MNKKGCRYCRMEENGDTPYDRKYIIFKANEMFTILKRAKADVGLFSGNELHLSIDVEDALCPSTPDRIYRGVAKIKYCPMCGRKLEREVTE